MVLTDCVDPVLGKFDLKVPILSKNGKKFSITNKILKQFGGSVVREANKKFNSAVVVDTLGMRADQVKYLEELFKAITEKARKSGAALLPIEFI